MPWRTRDQALRSLSPAGRPEAGPAIASRREPAEEWPDALVGRWILVIDDDPSVRVLSARVLLESGAICQLASTHESALQILAREPRFNVAILDFSMPDGDGPELVPHLLALRPELMVIGSSGVDRRLEFKEAGVERFLPKPWRQDDLMAVLNE